MADYNVVVKLVDQTKTGIRNIENGLSSIQSRTNSVNKALSSLGAGLSRAGAVAGAALSLAAKSALSYADAVQDASDASGIGTARILAFSQAVAQNGGDANKAIDGLLKFNQTIGDAAAGSQTARDALSALGVSLGDIANKSVEQNLSTAVDALASMGSASERAAKQSDVFGKALKGTNIAAFGNDLDALTTKQKANSEAVKASAQLVDNIKSAYTRLELSILKTIKPAVDFINALPPEELDKIIGRVTALGLALLAIGGAAVAINLVTNALKVLGVVAAAVTAVLALPLAASIKIISVAAVIGTVLTKAFSIDSIDSFISKLGKAYEWMAKLVGLGGETMPPAAPNIPDVAPTPPVPGAGTATIDVILKPFYESIANTKKEYATFLKLINSPDLVVASAAFDKLSAAAATLGIAIQKPAALIARDFNQGLARTAEELRIADIEYSNTAGQITKFTQELAKSANELSLTELRLGNTALMTEKFRQELQTAGIALTENQIKLDDAATQQNVYRNEIIASIQAIQDQEQRLANATLQQRLFDSSIQNSRISTAQQTQTLTLLNAAYAAGKISTDEYADAVGGLNARLLGANQIMAQAQSAAAQEVKLTADRKIAVDNLTAAYAANGGTGTKAFQAAATALGASRVQILTATTAYQSYADKIVEYNDMIKLSVENAAETFSDEFSKAFLKGENMLTSFKNFFGNIMNDIANNIIKKQLADPIAAAMNNIITGMMGSSGGGGGIGGILGGIFSGGLEQLSGPTGGGFFDSISSIFGFANGGLIGAGTTGLVGENGPEFITGPANITPMDQMGGTSAPNVTITINAIDTQTGVQFLLQNKPAIVSMVTDAYNRRGRSGPLD